MVHLFFIDMTFAGFYLHVPYLHFWCVFQVIGTPSEDSWPGVNSLPHFKPGETFHSVLHIDCIHTVNPSLTITTLNPT